MDCIAGRRGSSHSHARRCLSLPARPQGPDEARTAAAPLRGESGILHRRAGRRSIDFRTSTAFSTSRLRRLHQRIGLIFGARGRGRPHRGLPPGRNACPGGRPAVREPRAVSRPRREAREAARHVGQASHHRGDRLLGRRHHLGHADLRADFPPRRRDRRVRRGRQLPPLRSRGHARQDGGRLQRRRNYQFSHFGPDANLFAELEGLFRGYGATGDREAPQISPRRGRSGPYGQEARDVHAVGGPSAATTDLLFYEGLHGAVVDGDVDVGTARRSPDRRRAGHQSRMDPEASSRQG